MSNMVDLIVKTPGVCSGQPRIAGTRIKVKHVCTWVEKLGMTPREVIAEHPQLTPEQVEAALAYYRSHQSEIDQDIENEERFVAELKAKNGPSRLQEKRDARNGANDSLPPR